MDEMDLKMLEKVGDVPVAESPEFSAYGNFEDFGEYEGDRNQHGQRHGFGRATFTNGDIYEGEYENGVRQGKGKYRFENALYDGDYREGKRGGFGSMIYPDGGVYVGQWRQNEKNGQGKYTYQNGDTYEGAWKDDYREGFGTYVFKESNAHYMGHWKRGARHGPGEWVTEDYVYKGHFDEHLPVGRGKFIFDKGPRPTAQHGWYHVRSIVKHNKQGQEYVEDETEWSCQSLTAHHNRQMMNAEGEAGKNNSIAPSRMITSRLAPN